MRILVALREKEICVKFMSAVGICSIETFKFVVG